MPKWPRTESLLAALAAWLPADHRLEQLGRADVAPLIVKLGEWFPTITVGSESRHLHPEFYETQVALSDEDADRAIYVVTLRAREVLVGMASFEYDELARALMGRLVVIDPRHRQGGVGAAIGPRLSEVLGRAIGAELLLTTTTMRHAHGQRLLEAAGFELAGIIPGFDRDLVADGVVKRHVYEASLQ